MRVRTLLVMTAIVSAIIGGVVVYLVLTVPNDVQAAALLKTAKVEIAKGDNDRARESLSRIVQQYPRTDAAAAATVALTSLGDSERQKLAADLKSLQAASAAQQKQIAALGQRVDDLAARPVPQPAPPPPAKPQPRKTSSRRRRSRH
ncbi:MAG TPA: tetratricopeptide repeat protein [Thermoanaerobaculia bacterium]|nr:tetratricopeptide repeat protein [Thermoanaerobaculia bacterium]